MLFRVLVVKCPSLLANTRADDSPVVLATAALPTHAKRDDSSTFINTLLSNFESQKPAVSQAGTSLLSQLLNSLTTQPYSIPQQSQDPIIRTANINLVRTSFVYGPPIAGGPFYPSGLLGIAKSALDFANIQLDLTPELALAALDATKATVDISKYDGLHTLEDYTELYNGEWQNTIPHGPDPGVETNYTQDLLFSMQRLSTSPYQIRRLNPASDNLQFTIADSIAIQISGLKLQELFSQGRLFYADYRDQKDLTPSAQFSAACDGYFYIDTNSGDFLPLAIRTNVGANLVYTPLDSPNDWLLAKMMFNVNDFWFAQWNHLAGTHEVLQIVWQSAIRSLSQEHPVYAILNRLTYEVFSIQLLAEAILFIPGGAVDLVFPYTGQEAQSYTTDRYFNGGAGRFQSNYFETDLTNRGLINPSLGPNIKNFPFYEDAKVLHTAIETFITAFVNSYYSSDAVVAADTEIQNWVAESNGPAKVIDFPSKISSRDTLIKVLSHINMLTRMNSQTKAANVAFKISMQSFSAQVSSRSFDANGLSQGMPFVWQALDPNVAPYSVTT
ncbi:arachidonate 8-lipoxygenase [Xylariales sp. PMI_506]|nr:arachidonate 8-lipoxygenase [Xylariales sp. PMI_506]